MIGFLVFNGSLNTTKYNEVHMLYVEAGKKLGINIELVKNTDILSLFDRNKLHIKFKDIDKEPDFILFLDKDIRLANQLEILGYKVFNSSKAIEICDDKNYTYQELIKNEIKIPKTITSKIMFKNNFDNKFEYNRFIIDELGFPMVVKEAFGSFGQQVYLINNELELKELQEKIIHIPHLYQEFIESSCGRDVRIYIVDNQYVTSMYRYSKIDFRANVSNGGKMEIYEPSEEFIKIAIDATKAVGADFAGVDLLFDEKEKPIVCEVNSNAHIKNVFDCTGVNIGEYILKYIKENIENI